jgi:hypothetical protein
MSNMYKRSTTFLLTLLLLAMPALAQTKLPTASEKRAPENSLELPPFSIFGIFPEAPAAKFEEPLRAEELEKLLTQIKRLPSTSPASKRSYYVLIPFFMYSRQKLFLKTSWTQEEIEQGRLLGNFLSQLVDKPELKIEGADQESFKQGLLRLKNWYASLYYDNQTLGLLIFTMDDGPFFGGNMETEKFSSMKLIDSESIPGSDARFVLLSDENQQEPMIIGVLNKDNSIRWLKRFRNPPGRISKAELQKPGVHKIEKVGYIVNLMTNGSSGEERSRVYLDESLNLRFYFVSW